MSKRTSLFLFSTAALLLSSFSDAYELGTHARLTEKAYERSFLVQDGKLLRHLGLRNEAAPFGEIYYDISGTEAKERKQHGFESLFMPNVEDKLTIKGWLMRGAVREDDWARAGGVWWAPNPQDDQDPPRAFWRVMHHFYDPVRDSPLRLTPVRHSAFTTATGDSGEFFPAPSWALGVREAFQDPNTPHTDRPNHYSLLDAREAMYRALTGRNNNNGPVAPTEDERKKYWATTFRALGNVVHLTQDMAQPQHTRNDLHGGLAGFGHDSIYESYIDCRATGRLIERFRNTVFREGAQACPRLNYDGYPLPRFTKYSDFFSTREGLIGRGVADYSNRGFFSAGTNLGTSAYLSPSNDPASYEPEQVAVTTVDPGYESVLGPELVPLHILKGDVQDTLISDQSVSKVPLTTEGMWYLPLAEFSTPANAEALGYTLTRPNYDAAANLLIPRAVAYSAGLIDYFFRGRLEVQDAGFTDNGIVLRIKNAIDPKAQGYWKDETLGIGGRMVVTLRYELPAAPDGTTTHHHTSSVAVLDATLPPGRASTGVFTFNDLPRPPEGATNVEYRLVYRGPIGQEADAVAVGTFKPVSGFLVMPNYAPADELSAAGEPRLIYRADNQWRLSTDTRVLAGNVDWKGWYVNGSPTKALSWIGPPVRYFPETEFFEFGTRRFHSSSQFETAIYQGGEIFAVAPGAVLGATVARDSTGFDWLIVVCADGIADVVYRRPYKKSLSTAIHDPVNEPEGWQRIGSSTPTEGDPPGSFTQPPDIPWFFSGSGTEAQTMRRWWSGNIDWPGGLLKRLKLEIVDDVRHAAFTIEDRGDQGFVEARTCSASYDQFGAGSGQRISSSGGEYTFAVDYKNDRAVFAKIRVEGGSSSRSTVNVIHNHEPGESHANDEIVGQTAHAPSSYREYLVWDTGEVQTFSDTTQPYTVDWTSGATTTYSRMIDRQTRKHEVTYLLDLRSDYYAYYFWSLADHDVISGGVEQNTQNGDEGSEFLTGTSPETLHANTFPSFTSNRSLYLRTFEIRCGAATETVRTYGTSNFGWWSFFGQALGSAVVNSAGHTAHSQRLLADFGFEEVGTVNRLSPDGNFEALVPAAPAEGATYYPISTVR